MLVDALIVRFDAYPARGTCTAEATEDRSRETTDPET